MRQKEGESSSEPVRKARTIYDAEELEGFGGSQGQLSQERENEADGFDAYAEREMKRGREELEDEVDERRKRRNDDPEFQVRFPCLPSSPFAAHLSHRMTKSQPRKTLSRTRNPPSSPPRPSPLLTDSTTSLPRPTSTSSKTSPLPPPRLLDSSPSPNASLVPRHTSSRPTRCSSRRRGASGRNVPRRNGKRVERS